MNTAVCGVRWDVVRRLQRAERSASGEWAEILNHAISLALNDSRSVTTPNFLHRSVIRDARRILRRASQSHSHESLDPSGDVLAPLDLEESALARELEMKLRAHASRWGQDGEVCVEGMLANEPCDATCKRTGVPVRRLKYLRLKLREYLQTLLGET